MASLVVLSDSFACPGGTFPSTGLPCSASIRELLSCFDCVLFCCIWLLSLGGLLLFGGEYFNMPNIDYL